MNQNPQIYSSLLMIVLMFVVFYFFLIRPQRKRQKQHREMLAALKKGDKLLTIGGFYADLVEIKDDGTLIVDIAPGCRARIQASAVASVITNVAAEPVTADKN